MSNGTFPAPCNNCETTSLRRELSILSGQHQETPRRCHSGETPDPPRSRLPQSGWCLAEEIAAALQIEDLSFRRLVRVYRLPHRKLGRAMLVQLPLLFEAIPDGVFEEEGEVSSD
jgi:hypothetical protein